MADLDEAPDQALDEALDQALQRFQLCGLEYFGGLANHGPMAAEALCRLGHAALIPGLIDVYAPRLPPLETGCVISEAERISSLGDPTRLPDWVATFDREIQEQPWRELLREWTPVLLPGLAGAVHGWLRVAHAVRALTDAETDLRRRELALGLAYWAGRYQELPGRPSARPESECGVQACFDAVPVVPPEARRSGLFSHAIRVLDDDPGFAAVIEAFDPGDADLSTLLHQISCASARLYLEFPSQRITYVHCLTAASAVRLFADHLTAETLHRAVGYALQTALALHAVSADSPVAAGPNEETLRLAENLPDLRYRAACSLEEHAIKFTEACLRENEIQPDPVLRLAAADAALRLDAGSGRGASA